MKVIIKFNSNIYEIGHIGILRKDVSNLSRTIPAGESVEIIEKGQRGYDICHTETGTVIGECGWDIFIESK